MPLDLSGKYWRVYELEKKYNMSTKMIGNILKDVPGIIHIGPTYLIPDDKLKIFDDKSYLDREYTPLLTFANRIKVNSKVFEGIINNGFSSISLNDVVYLKISELPALEKAIDYVRGKYGKVSILKKDELIEKAVEYLNKNNNDQG